MVRDWTIRPSLNRRSPRAVVAANCGRVQEALRVLEEYARSSDPTLASETAVIRYGLYDLEVTCLNASVGLQRRNRLKDCTLCLITSPTDKLLLRDGSTSQRRLDGPVPLQAGRRPVNG